MKERNHSKKVVRCLTLISQFGIYMIVPIFMCSFAGIFLDRCFGTSFFMVLLFFVGAAAGFRNVYLLAMKVLGEDKPRHGEKYDKEKHS